MCSRCLSLRRASIHVSKRRYWSEVDLDRAGGLPNFTGRTPRVFVGPKQGRASAKARRDTHGASCREQSLSCVQC
jgi:hypothetical protein